MTLMRKNFLCRSGIVGHCTARSAPFSAGWRAFSSSAAVLDAMSKSEISWRTTTIKRSEATTQQLPTRRVFSSQPVAAAASPESRFRRRFYRLVDIAPTAAPWTKTAAASAANTSGTVESPVSAGVDGTQSASGVIGRKTNDNSLFDNDWKDALVPKRLDELRSGKEDQDESKLYDWYSVTLDGRSIKTPVGQLLTVPSAALAHMIASEWNAQSPYLQVPQMPLMTLACTALDQTATKQGMPSYKEQILRYLPTDSSCFFTDPVQDRVLYQKQEQALSAVHDAIQDMFGVRPGTVMSDGGFVVKSLPHPPALMQACKEWTEQLDAWHLTALFSMVAEAKSFLVGCALLNSRLSVKQALEAARVEEEFQIANWGLVEGGHDYDRLNASIQLHSAMLLKECLELDRKL